MINSFSVLSSESESLPTVNILPVTDGADSTVNVWFLCCYISGLLAAYVIGVTGCVKN